MSTSIQEAREISKGNIGSGCSEGHTCTSSCGNDYDCPCQSDHCCDMSEDPCGDVEDCEYCASKAPDLADLTLDNQNER